MDLSNLSKNAEKRIEESRLFTRQFGTFSKSDYEVLMFTIYLDSLEGAVRDYDISIDLGITESKVRSLRVRSQLLYPKEINWKEELATAIQHGAYDPETKQITVTIEDPSVKNLLKNIIEENFGTVGLSLNSKHLILPIESYLLLAACAEDNYENVVKDLNKKLKSHSKDIEKIEKKGIKTRFLKSVPDITALISEVLAIYQVGRPIVESVLHLIQQYV